MTDKEKILAEIERLKDKGKYSDTYDYAFREGNNGALDAIARFVNSLHEEPVSADLEEASIEFAKNFGDWQYALPCFKAGAQWQKEKTINKAVEWLDENLIAYWSQSYTDNDDFIEDFRKALEKD